MDIVKVYQSSRSPVNVTWEGGGAEVRVSADYSALETLQFWPHQVVLISLYSTIALVSFTLNSVTIAVLVQCDKICSELCIYLINLSLSDIVMSLLCIPFTYTNFILNRWIFPHFLCSVVNFAQICSVLVSIWTLTVIGIDRYFAIINPLQSTSENKCLLMRWDLIRRKKKLLSIITIWLVGVCSGSVQFVYTQVIPFQYGDETLYDCRENLPEQYAKLYTIYLFVSTFGLPLFILVYVYSIIGYQVWRHVAPGNPHHLRDRNNTLTREKVIKILLFIVFLFFLCWFPLQVFTLLVEFMDNFLQIRSAHDYRFFVYGYLSSHILAMSHSFVNPIVYCFISRNFWKNFCFLTRMMVVRVGGGCCASVRPTVDRPPSDRRSIRMQCPRAVLQQQQPQSVRTAHSVVNSTISHLHPKQVPINHFPPINPSSNHTHKTEPQSQCHELNVLHSYT